FCAREHVKDAPEAAAELVELAHEYEPFYNGLVSIYTTLRYLTLAKKGEHLARMGLRPVVHHAAPGPVTAAVGPLVGIPAAEIPEPVPHQHEHPPEPQPEPEQPPTPPAHQSDPPPRPPAPDPPGGQGRHPPGAPGRPGHPERGRRRKRPAAPEPHALGCGPSVRPSRP